MAYRVANELETQALEQLPPSVAGQAHNNAAGGAQTGPPQGSSSSVNGTAPSVGGNASAGGTAGSRKMDEEEERDAVFFRLEMLGYRVGQGLVERCVWDLSAV